MNLYGKWKKRIALTAALTLAAGSSFLVTACGEKKNTGDSYEEETETVNTQNEDTEKGMGRYLESDLNLPDNFSMVSALKFLDDGTLRLCYLDSDYEPMYADSHDEGDTWGEAVSLTDLLKLDTDQFSVSFPQLSYDGSIFVMVTEYSEENPNDCKLHYYYIDAKGKAREIQLDSVCGQAYITNSEFTENGTILLNTPGNGIAEIDPEDERVIRVYEEGNFVNYFGIADHIIAAVLDDSIHYYDVDTGKPVEGAETLSRQIMSDEENLIITSTSVFPVLFLQGDEEDSLFYVDSDGMYRYALGGSVVEQIIDGSLNSISSPDTGLVDMEQDDKGRFYLAVKNDSDGTDKVLRYEYSKDTPTVPDTELKVYSLTENSFMRQAAALFQKKYPDIYLELETGMTGEDAVTSTDALKTLNTEIMAGKGPDILILDGVPADIYVEKGMLEDISGIIGKINESDGILKNIMDPYIDDDGTIYYMPLKFAIPMIMGWKEDIEKITDLSTLADVIEEHQTEYNPYSLPTYMVFAPEILLRKMADVCADAWMKEDGTLDENAVSGYLSEIRRIFLTSEEIMESRNTGDQNDYINDLIVTQLGISVSCREILDKAQLLAMGGLYSPSDLAMIDSVEKESDLLTDKIWNGQVENRFLPLQTIGICSKANQKEAAEKFVEFLFSVEGQVIGTEKGLPVNEAVYENMDYWMKEEEGSVLWTWASSNQATGEMLEGQVCQPSRKVISRIQELGKTLDKPSSVNEFILTAVTDSGARYIKGEISLEEAVNAILQEVNLYLSE